MTTIPAVREKQPLPANPFKPNEEPIFYDAYEECLKHEQDGLEAETKGERDAVVNARCLGYLLIEALSPNGRHFVADEIDACKGQPSAMDALGRRFRSSLIGIFKRNKGETPTPSDHSSRSSFDEDTNSFVDPIDPAPSTAKLAALERDGYRCTITGYFDSDAWFALDSNGREALGKGVLISHTNFCHILPDIGLGNLDKAENSKLVLKYISAFGGIDGLEELQGAKMHRLSNGLTLSQIVHTVFDKLDLWFEQVPGGDPNTYLIRMMAPYPGVPTTAVTFTSRDPTLALPDPRYLKLHAAICRVAHMSGVAEYIWKHERDLEELSVLAPDGSSAGIFVDHLQQCLLAY